MSETGEAFTRKRREKKFNGKNKAYHWKIALVPLTRYKVIIDQ